MISEKTLPLGRHHGRARSFMFRTLGILFTLTGITGIVVPVLPSTIFITPVSGIFSCF
jgi:uncharacterized membrane protein YbaN (DUF454 family)